jgi:putative ABC transport system permease protein
METARRESWRAAASPTPAGNILLWAFVPNLRTAQASQLVTCNYMNQLRQIETLWRDVRYGARVLIKSPGFLLVALLSLALGIGATTAIFSVVYGVLISPYPYARPAEIWAPELRDLKNPQQSRGFFPMRDYVEMKKLPAFAEAMATNPQNRLLTGNRPPENFQSIAVTANAFQFLGVAPAWGRTIQPTDLKTDGQPEPVIVLSYKAWQRLFDASPAALGQILTLNDQPFTVIGVMPPRFGWWTNEGGWIAMPEDPRANDNVAAIVRMKPGVAPRVGEEQLQAMWTRSAQAHPDDFSKNGFSSKLQNYLDITVASGEMESSLRLLFGAVGFLLLIACANVANLQMARGTARAHEIAVRISVGAGRGRLFRQLLTESVLLSTVGGALGILFAIGLTRAVVELMPEYYVPNEARVTVNVYVLLFSAAVSVFTGILFGLAPALQSSRQNLADTLKDAGRSLVSSAGGRMRGALVVAEVALSVVLLMGASLTVRGFVNLQHLDLGFQSDRVLMVNLQLPPKRYPSYEQRIGFAQRVLDSVANLPGVRSVAIGNGGLPFGGPRSAYSIEGQPQKDTRTMYTELISADYPRTLGIALRAGRELTLQEIAHADPVALINETASKLWPAGVSPIGTRIRLDLLAKPGAAIRTPPQSSPNVTVVGVIADTRNDGLRDPTAPAAYIPYTLLAPPSRVLALRTGTQPMALLNAVRERIRDIDPNQPLSRPITLEDVVGFETVQPRFNMALFTFFGLLGLALAAAGIYSMLSYNVARRTHEIGIRMALGANSGNVLSLMLAMGGKLVLIGLAIGLAGSLALAKLLRGEVFQVPGTDPVALVAVVALLSTVAVLACLIPARRASRLDPMAALRHE